jgi:hypothetical protein
LFVSLQISAQGIRFLETLFRRFKQVDNTMPIASVKTMFDALSLTHKPQVKEAKKMFCLKANNWKDSLSV